MHTVPFFQKADEMLHNLLKKKKGKDRVDTWSKKERVALNTPVGGSCFPSAFFPSWTGESEIDFSPLGLKEVCIIQWPHCFTHMVLT